MVMNVAPPVVDLEEGEVICPKCNGSGSEPKIHDRIVAGKCSKCFGKGKLDWIENIVGIHRFSCTRCGGSGEDKPVRYGSMSWIATCPDCRGDGKN